MTVYDKGDNAVLTVTFKDAAGTATDPAVVKFRAVDPAGAVTNWTYGVDPQVTRTGTGAYSATLPLSATGLWAYYWTNEAGTVEDSVLEVVGLATERSAGEQTWRRRLVAKLSPTIEPVLTDADIDDLMLLARRVDSAGLFPSDTGYVATWTHASIDAAASEGWELRAGRCFDDIDFGEDGQRFNHSTRHQQCLAMAKLYRRGAGSVTISSAVSA